MRAMSPLAWKTDKQDELQLNPLGGIDTLKQNFPDSAELDKKHGKKYMYIVGNTRGFKRHSCRTCCCPQVNWEPDQTIEQ